MQQMQYMTPIRQYLFIVGCDRVIVFDDVRTFNTRCDQVRQIITEVRDVLNTDEGACGRGRRDHTIHRLATALGARILYRVVRKKLGLKLLSEKMDGARVYARRPAAPRNA